MKHRPFSSQEFQHPHCRTKLRQNRGKRGSAYSHAESKDKQRIQENIHHSSDEYGEHSHISKALAVDKRIHPQRNHHKNSSKKINADIISGVGKCCIACAKRIQNWFIKHHYNCHQHNSCKNQHGKRVSHEFLCLFFISPSTFHGTKRSTAISKKIRKRHYKSNDGKAESHTGQRQCSYFGYSSDIHTVHDII